MSSQADETKANAPLDLSIVIPVYEEEGNLNRLHEKICEALDPTDYRFEVIYVDDGSKDRSFAILSELAAKDERIKVIGFRRNFGQTAATAAGFEAATGTVIVPMDADLQNDPGDIPKLVAKLDEGYDVVSGWRKNRQDAFHRTLPSRIANRLLSRSTGVEIHDFGCTLKAYKRDVLAGVRLYGEMHRFIPALAHWQGAKVGEMVVTHHPRTVGVSKYGLSRTFKVLIDLLTVKFLSSFGTKPAYLFASVGVPSILLGLAFALMFLIQFIVGHSWIQGTTLSLLSVFLILVGIVFGGMGLLAELMVRTYHESQGRPVYVVRERLGFGDDN